MTTIASDGPESTAGTIRVFTFKEGLLSKVAHDLQLTLGRFTIELEDGAVRGRFWPATLRIDGAMRDGRLDPGGLSDKDRREIHGNITRTILKTDRHPEVELDATAGDGRLRGTLRMMGREAPIELRYTQTDGRVRGEVELVPTRWGIAPYKALLGAIKLQDRVRVEVDLARPDAS